MANINADINAAARKWGVSPVVLRRLLNQESGLNPNARSGAGAQGIAQFMPATARAYGVNVNDATSSIFGAAHYLHDNLAKTGGSYAQALSIYNSGRPDAYKDPKFAGGQTYNYVKAILGGTTPTAPTAPQATQTTTTTPGVDNSGARKALLLSFIQNRHAPNAVANLAVGLQSNQDVPGTSKTVTTPGAAGPVDTSVKGVGTFEGKKVAAWIVPLLKQARANGWKGQVTSGYRSYADQAAIYNRGVRPAAKPGTSNHEMTAFPGGAIDVTDPQGLVRTMPKGSPLRWAGAKDPVHLSVPHNGSY